MSRASALTLVFLSMTMGIIMTGQEKSMPSLEALTAMTARFAPVEIAADIAPLPGPEVKALARLVAAGRVLDALFLRQVWAGNEGMLFQLLADETPLGRARLHYFLINKGPWSRLDHNAPFVPGAPPKPAAANFYPPGATKADVDAWFAGVSEADRALATGFFATIRRKPGVAGGFEAVPYSLEYQGELAEVAGLLREAAALTSEPTLRAFLDRKSVV